jgi:thioredoxin
MDESPFIIDVTRENYAQVMETSFNVPVLIDFWASWCQPCQVLMPILARLAEEYQGKFLLGKLNTEEQQEIAAQFGIRSIPNVKLFRNGQPVDEFMGALPEKAVREFLDRHVARDSDAQVAEALEQLRAGNAAGAVMLLDEAREADPDNPRITVALAQAQAAGGNIAAAEATLDSLPANERDKPEVAAVRNHLYFEGGQSRRRSGGSRGLVPARVAQIRGERLRHGHGVTAAVDAERPRFRRRRRPRGAFEGVRTARRRPTGEPLSQPHGEPIVLTRAARTDRAPAASG